ncbi:MAG: hypothetical protein U0W40_16795 [Acidimicrobiia bacterium]
MSVLAAPEPTQVLHLDVAGRPLRIELHGDAARAAVGPALGHLETGAPVPEATPFRVWCDDDEVHPLWEPAARGPARLGEQGLAVSRPEPPMLEAFTADGLELWGTASGLAAGDTVAHPPAPPPRRGSRPRARRCCTSVRSRSAGAPRSSWERAEPASPGRGGKWPRRCGDPR